MLDRVNVQELLGTSDLQVRTGNIAWKHVRAEFVDVVEDILETLAPSGPYAYTVAPRIEAGKELPTQVIATTYEQIEATYRGLHRYAAVVDMRPMTEIRGSWYTFISGMGRGRDKSTGAESERPIIVIFPTMGSEGITGELFWGRTQQATMPGEAADGPQAGRLAMARFRERLVEALGKGDVDTIVELAHPEIQTGVRDYISHSGTLVELHDKEGLRAHLQDFYDHYTVHGIDTIQQAYEDWFFFHELRWTVEARRGPDAGSLFRYHTAEYSEVSAAGLVTANIGHGTDQIKLA